MRKRSDIYSVVFRPPYYISLITFSTQSNSASSTPCCTALDKRCCIVDSDPIASAIASTAVPLLVCIIVVSAAINRVNDTSIRHVVIQHAYQ